MTTQRLSFVAIAALLVDQWGCAGAPPPRPSDAVLAQVGAAGVVAVEFAPETDYSRPVPGKPLAAVVGMTAGFGEGLRNAALCPFESACGFAPLGSDGRPLCGRFIPLTPPFGPSCWIALWTPFMMGAGVVEGADKGITIAEWIESSRALSRAAAAREAQETLRDTVIVAAGERQTARPVVSLLEGGPRGVKAPSSYRPLAATGLDTVLEVGVVGLELARVSQGGPSWSYGPAPSWREVFNPSLNLIVEAQARLVRVADDAVLFSRPYRYPGATRYTFVEWARDGAEAFREARHTALQRLGEEIASDFFGPAPLPASAPAEPLPLPLSAEFGTGPAKFFRKLRGDIWGDNGHEK